MFVGGFEGGDFFGLLGGEFFEDGDFLFAERQFAGVRGVGEGFGVGGGGLFFGAGVFDGFFEFHRKAGGSDFGFVAEGF